MARLAEYMAELAKLMANQDRVHFQRLDAGSTVLVSRIEPEAVPKVNLRLMGLENGTAPDDTKAPYLRINDLLRDDDAVGRLTAGSAQLIRFPGREIPRPTKVGPFFQTTVIDGELVRIGGRDNTAHATIQDSEGRTWNGELDRALARELAKHLYAGPILRVEGNAKWERSEQGAWDVKGFRIRSFKELPSETLLESVDRIRGIKGSEWKEIDDPAEFIRERRTDSDEVH